MPPAGPSLRRALALLVALATPLACSRPARGQSSAVPAAVGAPATAAAGATAPTTTSSTTSTAAGSAGSTTTTSATATTTTTTMGTGGSGAVPDPRFAMLPELTFRAINTRETLRVRLYRADGQLDPEATTRLAHLLRDIVTGADSPVVPRTLALLVRLATHFDATQIEVVSAYRSGLRADGRRAHREGYHGVGSAIDFRVPGVDAARVAAYARTFAHVGVGYYPREGFVHLDSREQTFFWENLAGRGHHGWNRPLDRTGVPERDAVWTPQDDVPWDPPGATVALVLHPRTQPGAHRPHRHAGHHRHAHARPPLHVFRGAQ